MNKFSQRVYQVVAKIPKGKVTTYLQIAKLVGNPKSARRVGQALKNNPKPVIIPCHRVVKSGGSLGGYANGGALQKAKLLKKEGIAVKNGKLDLKKYGWQP